MSVKTDKKNQIFFPKVEQLRGSDYIPAIALSEEKDKLVTENWRQKNEE